MGRGEILGLLGPNGAGKTTTMRILTGYLTPTAGSVRVQDLDVGENRLAVKRLIGYLPEFAPLYADMLVHDYLSYVAAVRRVPRERRPERIRELVALCGLLEVVHRPFRELSRGYKQRVGLAHALMGDPDILVLDEPTAGLDPNQIVEIRRIIREAGKKKTVIFSTHILSEAESTCDRIIIIDRGRVVADGTAEQIKTTVASGMVVRVQLLEAALSDARSHLLAVPGVEEVTEAMDGSRPEGALVLDVRCQGDPRKGLYAAVKQRDWILIGMQASGQSLEDTFRELTSGAGEAPTADGAEAGGDRLEAMS